MCMHVWQSQVENKHYSILSWLIRLVISLECFIEITPDFLCPFMNDWGISEFLYEAPATSYPLQYLHFKREALSAMEAFKHLTANNKGMSLP